MRYPFLIGQWWVIGWYPRNDKNRFDETLNNKPINATSLLKTSLVVIIKHSTAKKIFDKTEITINLFLDDNDKNN